MKNSSTITQAILSIVAVKWCTLNILKRISCVENCAKKLPEIAGCRKKEGKLTAFLMHIRE